MKRGADFWAMFAAAARGGLHTGPSPLSATDHSRARAKECAEFADAMLEEFYKRYEWIENSVACGWRRRK